MDEARALTGARYGALVTFDDAGEIDSNFTSGISPKEHQNLWCMPGEMIPLCSEPSRGGLRAYESGP